MAVRCAASLQYCVLPRLWVAIIVPSVSAVFCVLGVCAKPILAEEAGPSRKRKQVGGTIAREHAD